jgi:hypothetical protein
VESEVLVHLTTLGRRLWVLAVCTAATVLAVVVAGPSPAEAAPPRIRVSYTGPLEAQYGAPTSVSADVTLDGVAYEGAEVSFDVAGANCTATTGSGGSASCVLSPQGTPDWYGLIVRATIDDRGSGTTRSFKVTKAATSLRYTGTEHIANAEPAVLKAQLKDAADQTVAGREVDFALGSGDAAQKCGATTDSAGVATCTVATVDQPLNDDGTVPVTVAFAGDVYYLGSDATARVLLQYATGRAYGMSAKVDLPLLPITVPPQPDTGQIRTARATRTAPPCSAAVRSLVVDADSVCAEVVTSLAPGRSQAVSSAAKVHIGIPGLPLIEASGIEAVSTSTCEAATGSTGLTLTIAGEEIPVPDAPNTVIDLGAAQLVVNEQLPVKDADYGLTVNALHLKDTAGLIDVVVASSTSDAHNCAPKESR